MNNKLKAFLITVSFAAIVSGGALLLVLATLWIPLDLILYTLVFGMLAYGFWLMYQVTLDRLDRDDERNRK